VIAAAAAPKSSTATVLAETARDLVMCSFLSC
jgi:hypothetical protein